MNHKILFIANVDESQDFPFYIKEFIDKGYKIKICRISGMFPRSNLLVRIKRRMGFNIREDVRKRKKSLECKIISAVNEFEPDIVYEINGMMLNDYSAEYIRKRSFLITNMIDRISFFPEYYEEGFSKHYDVIYTYSIDDCMMINSISNNCVFVPAMCEETVYNNKCFDRDIDVSFVGRLYPEKDYGYRYKILSRLVVEMPGLNIFVGGECAPLRRPMKYLKWRTSLKYRNVFINRQISKKECNIIYNRSKISISMERIGTGNSWSGRLVNLFGTKTFVLASDESEMLKKYFAGCYVRFDSYEDLKDKIRYYLQHEEERVAIAEKAYDRINKLKNDPIYINMTDDIIDRYKSRLEY